MGEYLAFTILVALSCGFLLAIYVSKKWTGSIGQGCALAFIAYLLGGTLVGTSLMVMAPWIGPKPIIVQSASPSEAPDVLRAFNLRAEDVASVSYCIEPSGFASLSIDMPGDAFRKWTERQGWDLYTFESDKSDGTSSVRDDKGDTIRVSVATIQPPKGKEFAIARGYLVDTHEHELTSNFQYQYDLDEMRFYYNGEDWRDKQ